MALFRKFFYRKPPDGLLEISERVFVFDCCFTTDILEEEEYKEYLGGIVGQLREYFPEASFMVFNFREGEHQSQIGQVLSEYDMTVMDYPRHYEGCPLLTMETVHHFLRSSESWLSLGHQNVLLMHCERGGWPVLAFMLAALLIYRKQFTGEQKTLDMIYKQAPRELLQLMSPLNPLPSQLRVIPNFDGEGGCCPIFRIYGQDPLMVADRTPKVLFSTPKRSKLVRHYKQADCELVKIDIHCHIQGDVVLECISLDSDQEREEMMFRVMFNTAFIRSNILMLNRDEIDILWNSKDLFSKEFRAEVLFSEMDAATSLVSVDLPGIEEKDGLPIEAFAKVQEIFSNVDWLDPKLDVAVNMLQHFTPSNFIQENLETALNAEKGSIMIESALEKDKEQLKLKAPDNIGGLASISQGKPFMPSVKPALDANSFKKKNEPKELLVSLQQPAQPKIISPRLPQTSSSASQGSPISRYHSAPSSLGITALLHDHDKYIQEITQQVKRSQPAVPTSPSVTNTMRPPQPSHVSTPSPTPPPLPFQPPSARASLVPPKIIQKTQVTPPPPLPTLKATQSFLSEQPETTSQSIEHLLSDPSTTSAANSAGGTPVTETLHSDAPSPPPSFQETSPSPMFEHSSTTSTLPPPPPPPPHSFPGMSQSFVVNNSFSIPPPPPPPPPPHSFPGMAQSFVVNNSFSIPPPSSPPSFSRISSTSSSDKNSFSAPSPPPQPPSLSGISPTSSAKNLFSTPPPPPPPPPPSPSPFSVTSPSTSVKNSFPNPPPPPPSPPPSFLGTSLSSIVNNSVSIPPPPPLPPMVASSTTSSVFCPLASKSSAITSRPPPPPPPPLHSRGSTSMSLARPPPQLPASNLPPENSLSHNSAPVPPVPPPPAPFAKGLSLSKANDVTPPSHSGIELRRANNCEIMLTKVKIPLPDLMFFLELMKVPRVESKLRVFSFKIQFQTQVRNSIKLKRIMQTILSLGNALNHGTARGSAVGFRLDSLLKLTDTRARNNKMTLMHYLCKIQLKFLAEEMQAISKGLEKVVQELTASENDGEVSGNFCKLLKEFLSYAEGEVRSLALLYSSVGRNADALAQYFGEDPARCPFEQVVSTLLNFVKMFVLAHEENCRQLEFERKKAEKAVENEKLKTQKGQSEHLVQNPLKSSTIK
ncbi:hypothetical protein CUMW_081390 [Citrus unshiu]|nr:hypothetical protein CUMW_081390 [Citrus unshiu]